MNYSQSNEQEAILKYFGDFVGTFLDLGSNDGVTLSNTRALAELGWCGCFVEPSPVAFSKLKSLYEKEKKGCFYLYNCAVGLTNGTATLHDSGTLLKVGDTGLVSTLVKKETERFSRTVQYSDVEVKVYRWKTLLNRLSIKKFDFLSVDCEGLDHDILIQIDLKDVKLLCIEVNGNKELEAKILEYTSKFGMSNVIYRSAENVIIAR
jgi:FkbM family methyltransferase